MGSSFASSVMIEPTGKPRVSIVAWIGAIVGGVAFAALMVYHLTHLDDGHGDPHAHAPPYWGLGILPFIGILGSIAILPLLRSTHHWWENNLNRLLVSLVCAGLTIIYYAVAVAIRR